MLAASAELTTGSAIDIQGLIRLALRLNEEMNFVGAYGVADYAYEGIGAILLLYKIGICSDCAVSN